MSKRRNLVQHVILPIAVLVAVAMVVVVGFVWFSAQKQDEIAFRQSIESVRAAIAVQLERMGNVAQDYGWWSEAVENMDINLNPDWADNMVGTFIYDTYGFEMTFVIDRGERTTYASIEGERGEANASTVLSAEIADLVAEARSKAGDKPSDKPSPAVALIEAAGRPALVAVSALTPDEETPFDMPAGPRVVLTFVKWVDQPFLDTIAERLNLNDLTFAAEAIPGPRATFDLVSPGGSKLATLVWTPHRPGREFLRSVAPSLAIAIAIIAAFTLVVLRHARQATQTIVASEARFRDVADASSDWIWETDGQLRLAFLSERFAAVTGVAPDEVLGRPLDDLLHTAESADRWERHHEDLRAWRPFRNLLCLCEDSRGQTRTLRVAGKPVLDDRGHPAGYRGTATDITAEIEAERRAQYLALHDSLTELPNRELLRERLEQAVASVSRRGDMAAVVCLDLDRFKDVNDTLGHSAGDLLIKRCAERLQACVREIDTVARIGGDEFAIVQVGLDQPDDTQRLCRRLLKAIAVPFDLEGHEVLVTASIGVALVPLDGSIPARLLQNADIALYRAKDDGRNTFRFFEPEMDARIQDRKALERDLRRALARDELELYFQPKIRVDDHRLSGVEALVRWHHPERGLVPPGDFIGVAEETGLILSLGEWVLRAACLQAAAWRELQMSVNISPVQFRQQDLATVVRRALAESELAPERLELEITESVLMQNIEGAIATLKDLKELGVRVAMDDFGTGYSSLSYLQKFPFDKIKIDRSFVRELGEHADATAIVRAVVGLGHSLGMQTCAEGVETAEQMSFLESEGCDEVQGYFFGRPMPVVEFQNKFLAGTVGRVLSPVA